MNAIAAQLISEFASATSTALVAAVWQGALLALLVWACLRLVPGLSATVRSAVWLCVFVLLVSLQVAPLLLHSAQKAAAAPALPFEPLHFDPRWSLLLAAVWLTASLVRAAQLAHGVLYLRRLLSEAKEAPQSPELRAALAEAADGRRVILCTSDQIARPSVIGFFRPRVLIPARLLENLTPAELKQVLIHELEHLRRADDWTNLLQKLALVVFPLNPALAWVERRLCAERELACDDRVLASGSGRKAYALCLTRLAEFALLERGFSLALGAWERRPELARRVHRILRAPSRTMRRPAALAVSGGVLASAFAGALVLAHSPQLVSFAPLPVVAQASVAARPQFHPFRESMPMPQLVKASLPIPHRNAVKSVRAAVMPRKPAVAEPEIKLAALRLPPLPGENKLLVMTEWNDLGNQQKMILAEFREGQAPAANAIPAVYIVATPNGWLIVQI